MAQEPHSGSFPDDPTVLYMLPGLPEQPPGTHPALLESQRRSHRAEHDQTMPRRHPVKLESKQLSSDKKDSAFCAPNMLYATPVDGKLAATTLLHPANTGPPAGPGANPSQATEWIFNNDPTPQSTVNTYNTTDGTSATLRDILTELRCLQFQVHTLQQTLSYMGFAADWPCSPSGNLDATYQMEQTQLYPVETEEPYKRHNPWASESEPMPNTNATGWDRTQM